MKNFISSLTLGLGLFCLTSSNSSADPGWWEGIFGDTEDNVILCVGQAKYVFSQAKQHLDEKLACVGGAGDEIKDMVADFQSGASSDKAPIALGQLKYLAAPFYDRLREVGYTLDDSLHPQGYPWTEEETDDLPNAPVAVGQLRKVADFDLVDWTILDVLNTPNTPGLGVQPASLSNGLSLGGAQPHSMFGYPADTEVPSLLNGPASNGQGLANRLSLGAEPDHWDGDEEIIFEEPENEAAFNHEDDFFHLSTADRYTIQCLAYAAVDGEDWDTVTWSVSTVAGTYHLEFHGGDNQSTGDEDKVYLVPQQGIPSGARGARGFPWGVYDVTATVSASDGTSGSGSSSGSTTTYTHTHRIHLIFGRETNYNASVEDAAGPRYRKVGLNGWPLPDEKPQASEEADQAMEESFVDAFTLQLTHHTSDVYVPLGASQLPLQVRRTAKPEIFRWHSGLRPDERPDRPFGPCWSSNICAPVEFMKTENRNDNQSPEPTNAYVTDENGATLRFVNYNYNNARTWHPVPGGIDDRKSIYNTFEKQTDGTYLLTKKFGTKITYEMADVSRNIPGNRCPVNPASVSSVISYRYARIKTVEDRYGNKITYSYPNEHTLIPWKISDEERLQFISINKVDGTELVGEIIDPRGNKIIYEYYVRPNESPFDCQLKSMTVRSGSTILHKTQYDYNAAVEDVALTEILPDAMLDDYSCFINPGHLNLSQIITSKNWNDASAPQEKYTVNYAFNHSMQSYTNNTHTQEYTGTFTAVGLPRWVNSVNFTYGRTSIWTSEFKHYAQTRLQAWSGAPTSGYSVKWVGLPQGGFAVDGTYQTEVEDSRGVRRRYIFSNAKVARLDGHPNNPIVDDPKSAEFGIYYEGMTIDYLMASLGGTQPANPDLTDPLNPKLGEREREIYKFSLAAGLSLTESIDLCQVAIQYSYEDDSSLPNNMTALNNMYTVWDGSSWVSGTFANWDDPTKEEKFLWKADPDPDPENADDAEGYTAIPRKHYTTTLLPSPLAANYGSAKTFTYETTYRQMQTIVDEEGRETVYTFDIYGNRTKETVYTSTARTTKVRETAFECANTTFPAFMTKKTIVKLPGDTTASSSIVTAYTPTEDTASDGYSPKGMVWKERVGTLFVAIVTEKRYDGNGNNVWVKDPKGYTTRFTYDNRNRLVTTIFPTVYYSQVDDVTHANLYSASESKTITYYTNGRKHTETNENGNTHTSTYTFHTSGNKYRVERSQFGSIVTYAIIDHRGGIVGSVDANGTLTKFDLDLYGRITRQHAGLATTVSGGWPTGAGSAKTSPWPVPNAITIDQVTSFEYSFGAFCGGTVFDSAGFQPTKITNPRGYVTEMEYDGHYNLVLTRSQYGTSAQKTWTSNVYDNVGNLRFTVTQDFNPSVNRKYVTQKTYDAVNRVVWEQFADNTTRSYVYCSVGPVHIATDENGNQARIDYDFAGRKIKEYGANPTGTGGINTTSSPLTEYRYDKNSNVVKRFVRRSNGETINTSANFNHDYLFDQRNRLIVETMPSVPVDGQAQGHRPKVYTRYDGVGNVRKITVVGAEVGAVDQVTLNIYNNVERLVETRHPSVLWYFYKLKAGATAPWVLSHWDLHDSIGSPVTLAEFDGNGNITKVTDPNGNVTINTYDAFNRLATSTTHTGVSGNLSFSGTIVNRFRYDRTNNRVLVRDGMANADAASRDVIMEYDGLNRLTKTIHPEISHGASGSGESARSESLTYDAINKISRTDAKGQVTNYTYDKRHRLKTEVYFNDGKDDDLKYFYDRADNLVEVWVGSITSDDRTGKGRDVKYTYDRLYRVITEKSALVTHTYIYDLANNRTQVNYGSNGATVLSSTYDRLNRLRYMYEYNNGSYSRTTSYGYDIFGNIVKKSYPNGIIEYSTYDSMNRKTLCLVKKGSTELYRYIYSYDKTTNVTVIRVYYNAAYPGLSGAQNWSVMNLYDDTCRLVWEHNVLGIEDETIEHEVLFWYDKANNRRWRAKQNWVGVAATVIEFQDYDFTNKLNQLEQITDFLNNDATLVSYSYDLNGNRASRIVTGGSTDDYSYDFENRLTSLSHQSESPTHTSSYDPRTRRVERSISGTYARVVFSGGVSVQEYAASSGGSPTVNFIRGSDWGGGVGGMLYSIRGTTAKFSTSNGRGDIVAQTDANGNVTWYAAYEAFGTRAQESGTNSDPHRANTKEEDIANFLLNEGHRYRDLEAGIFLTRDPAGFVDGPNLYTYVNQNPWSKFDPEGLETKKDYEEELTALRTKIKLDQTDRAYARKMLKGAKNADAFRYVKVWENTIAGYNSSIILSSLRMAEVEKNIKAIDNSARMIKMVTKSEGIEWDPSTLDDTSDLFKSGMDLHRVSLTAKTLASAYVGGKAMNAVGRLVSRVIGRFGSKASTRGAKPTSKFKPPTNPPQLPPSNIPKGTRIFRGKPTQQYPNGYWKIEKFDGQGWQRLDPRTMKPGPHPDTHIPFPKGHRGPFDN